MKIERIDLYEYFNIKRPENGCGYLNIFEHATVQEYCGNRIRPAMIVIAGGGYAYRSGREDEPVAMYYFNKGFNSYILDYSVAPVSYPYQLIEGCMAVAFLRENAEKLHIDKEHICSVGFSAGGHLCAMLATITKEKVVEDFLGKERAKLCTPNAVILSYPVITSGDKAHRGSIDNISGGNKELAEFLSLEKRVDKYSVPAFIWCTADDPCVPSENSLYMATEYKKHGIPFELHIFSHGQHGLSLANSEVNTPESAVEVWADLSNVWLKNKGFNIKG